MKLRIATCQFTENWKPRQNAARIGRYIAAAAAKGADIVHFHECALSGYAGKITSPDYDWAALREAGESLLAEARRHQIWVVVGSAHPLTPPHRPHNSMYVISPRGQIVDRYDKHFLMPNELDIFTPGDSFVTFRVKGVTCGVLICFDLRFPEIYRQMVKRGVQVLLQGFHNGRMDGPGIHEHIMRQTMQANAASNGLWVSAPNSSAPYCRWGSVFIQPDGLIAGRLPRTRAGMMVNTADTALKYYDPISAFRPLAMAGRLHNGRLVRDRRSDDRNHL